MGIVDSSKMGTAGKDTRRIYNMVRIIAGTLIDVGQGRLKPEDMKKILEARDRSAAGQTAPAKGLTLVGYQWPENIFIRDESGRCRQELS